MKKFIPLLITMLLSIMYAHAQYPRNQQIQAAEYFLNTDPGIGNGTPITIIQGTDITMNLTNLNVPVGSHIYVRVQSTNGFWSAPRCITRYNYSVMTGATLQYGEYFINTDPGQGNAIPINFASGIANLNNQNLQQGDVVYFRIKDSYNRWSPARGFKYQYKDMRRAEYKIKLASNGSYTTTTFNVTAAPDTTCPFTGIKNNITWHTNDSIWVHYQTKEGFYSAWKRGVVASACNDQTVCYGADATLTASGGSSYQWSNSMAGSSILVTPDSATTYHVTVSDGQGSWSTDSTTVFVSPLPLTSANPVGTDTLCQNFPNTSYTTTGALYATSYQWDILPSTAGIITGTGTTGTVDWNSTFYGTATIKVKGIDSCGSGPFSNVLTIVVKPAPLANAGIDQAVCFGTSVTLTATGGGNYAWNNGVTQSVAFTPTTTATYTVSVTGYNGCSTSDNVIVTVNPFPAAAGTISGFATVCQGQNAVMYSVPSIANATSYVWTLPSGATGSSTTNSISLNFGTSSITDYIIVKGTDSCGDGAASSMLITVNPLPSAAGVITGNITVCQGDNATYTVPVITNATNYNWTLPSGVTITSGSGTNSITIHFGSSGTGNITVKGYNSCGNGIVSSPLFITINPTPSTPIITINYSTNTLTSNASIGNQWYLNNAIISGATNQVYVYSADGDYFDIVSVNGCSSDTSNVISYHVGIDEYSTSDAIKVYPNPANNIIIIENSIFTKDQTISVYDIHGQLLKQQPMPQTKINIDVSAFSRGMYFVKVKTEKGMAVKKFIKE